MITRAITASLIAFFGISYLIGGFRGGRDALVALLVAGAVGVGVAHWLERDRRTGPPDVFDERAMRRAVRRGVARTGLSAVVWLLVFLVVTGLASTGWQTRGDRTERIALVLGHGFAAAYPGLAIPPELFCCSVDSRSMEFRVQARPRSAGRDEAAADVRFEFDLLGRLDPSWFASVPTTTAVETAAGVLIEKQDVARQLDRLPEAIIGTAVIELEAPLDVEAFEAFLRRHRLITFGMPDVPVYLEHVNWSDDRADDRQHRRVSWPTTAVAGFQAWVKQLRRSDDDLLHVLGLPGVDRLWQLAQTPRIHGFVLEDASPARLRSLLRDVSVRNVSLGDVALDVDGAP